MHLRLTNFLPLFPSFSLAFLLLALVWLVRYLLVLSGHRHLCVTYIEPAVHRTVAGDSISSSFIAGKQVYHSSLSLGFPFFYFVVKKKQQKNGLCSLFMSIVSLVGSWSCAMHPNDRKSSAPPPCAPAAPATTGLVLVSGQNRPFPFHPAHSPPLAALSTLPLVHLRLRR